MAPQKKDPKDVASCQVALTRETWQRVRAHRTIDNRMTDVVKMLLDCWESNHTGDTIENTDRSKNHGRL